MKIRYTEDEWYPVFVLTDSVVIGVEAEVDDALVERFNRALDEFDQAQRAMWEAVGDK